MDVETSCNQREVNVLVRQARPDDVAAIYDILTSEGITDELPAAKDFIRDLASPSWVNVLVAEQGQEVDGPVTARGQEASGAVTARGREASGAVTRGLVVGVAVYCRAYWPRPAPPGRVVLLRGLRVRPCARRRGVGTTLFRELCKVAQEEKAQINWSYHPNNTAAAAFFTQFKPDISDDLDGTYYLRIYPRIVREIALGMSGLNTDITVEIAQKVDMKELKMMIREISELRGTADDAHLDEKDLVEDGFTSPPWFFALIARRGTDVVGTVIGHRGYNAGRTTHMLSLLVRPAARGCGLAKKLIVEFCRMVEEEVDRVEFHVHPVNIEACSLYQKFDAERVTMWDDHVSFRLEIDKINEILKDE